MISMISLAAWLTCAGYRTSLSLSPESEALGGSSLERLVNRAFLFQLWRHEILWMVSIAFLVSSAAMVLLVCLVLEDRRKSKATSAVDTPTVKNGNL